MPDKNRWPKMGPANKRQFMASSRTRHVIAASFSAIVAASSPVSLSCAGFIGSDQSNKDQSHHEGPDGSAPEPQEVLESEAVPFSPLPPRVYAAKAKDVLT